MDLKPKIPKIEVKFKDMPTCIKDEVIKYLQLFAILILFTVFYSIRTLNIQFFIIGLLMLIALFCVFLLWYFPFAFGRVLVIEGIVTEIDDISDKKMTNSFFNPIVQRWVRMTYTLENEEGVSIRVTKTGNTVKKENTYVRLFVPISDIYENKDEYIVNKVLFTEVIKKK